MSIKTNLWRSLICLLLFGAVNAVSAQEIDWWTAQRQVEKELKGQGVMAMAKSFAAAEPTQDKQVLLRRLIVFQRAGYRRHGAQIIKALPQNNEVLSAIAKAGVVSQLLENQEWELARLFIEHFPQLEKPPSRLRFWQTIGSTDFVAPLINHWRESGKPVEEIDAWLVARVEANPEPWTVVRIGFLAGLEQGKGRKLLEQLALDVREHPQDFNKARLYLIAWSALSQQYSERPSLDWLGEVCRPASAIEADRLAGSTMTGKGYRGAVLLFQYSLRTPLTDEEIERYAMTYPVDVSRERLKLKVRLSTKENLARCYLELNKPELAQPLMEEVMALRKKHGINETAAATLAGRTQRASGQRVIQKAILQEEDERADSFEYWHKRARYFVGRDEREQAEEAFLKALKLASPGMRGNVLGEYYSILTYQQAAELCFRELANYQQNLQSAQMAASWLAVYSRREFLNADHPAPWSYLKQQESWEHSERRLLSALLESVAKEQREPYIARAEQLTRGSHPFRAYALGETLAIMNEHHRAIPSLEDAVRRLEDKQNLGFAMSRLLSTYVRITEWIKAEKLLAKFDEEELDIDQAYWHGRLALNAASLGAKKDAMRLWQLQTNYDFSDLENLELLASRGLQQELIEYYQEMAKQHPESWVPSQAVKLLKGINEKQKAN